MSQIQTDVASPVQPASPAPNLQAQRAVTSAFGRQMELMRKFDSSRAAYVSWLNDQSDDAFEPATREEVLALYDLNCSPNGMVSSARCATSDTQLNVDALLHSERVEELAFSVADKKALAAYHLGDISTRYVAMSFSPDVLSEQLLYNGSSLALAVDCYSRGAPLQPDDHVKGMTIHERIAESERNPRRKAALDRARIRRALATLKVADIEKMTPEQAIEALCATPEGKTQYELISTRAPGAPYKSLHRCDDGMSVDELISSMTTTPETAAEFEQASRDVRAALGLEGPRSVLQTLAGAVSTLLTEVGCAVSSNLWADDGKQHESTAENKKLLSEIAGAVMGICPAMVVDATPANILVALKVLGQGYFSLLESLESNNPADCEHRQELMFRISSVLENIRAKELLAMG